MCFLYKDISLSYQIYYSFNFGNSFRQDMMIVYSMKQTCSNCSRSFVCDSSTSCWCNEYPKITADRIKDEKDCLCKDCLLEQYRKKINSC